MKWKNKIAVIVMAVIVIFSLWIYCEEFGEKEEVGVQATDFTLTINNISGNEIDGETIHVLVKLKANVHAVYEYQSSGTRSGSTTCCGATSTWTANYYQRQQYLYKTLYLNTIPSPYTQSIKTFTYEVDIPNFIRSGEDQYLIDINNYEFGNKVQVYSYSLTPYAVCVGCSQDVRFRTSESGARLTGQDPSLVKFYQDGSRTSSITIRRGDITLLSAPQITNFQQIPIDLTHEKVTFNTDVNCISTYYLKIGGSWYLQNTGSNTKNHSYTFTVDEYTPIEYKIVATDQSGITAEKPGIIRTTGPEICGDGIDNDGDGYTDWEDIDDCICVTITKGEEIIGTTTYYRIFKIYGDAKAWCVYSKGSGSPTTIDLIRTGQDYTLSLEDLVPDSLYNCTVLAEDISSPENCAEVTFTFNTNAVGGIIEVTETKTVEDTFSIKFTINATTVDSLQFQYRRGSSGTTMEEDPNHQGDNNYALEIENLTPGEYQYVIEASTDAGEGYYEGEYTIESTPPPTTTALPTLPPTTSPPLPPEDYSWLLFFGVVIVILVLCVIIIYLLKPKKLVKKSRKK